MGLEQASEALHESLNTDTQPQELAPAAENKEEVSLVDLDTLDKFRWQGKDWTRDELNKSHMLQSEFTKRNQALIKERETINREKEFRANLRADVEKVRTNPQLAAEFLKVYPREYHFLMDDFLRNNQQQSQAVQAPKIDPSFERRMSQIEDTFKQQDEALKESQVEAAGAQIDSVFTKMSAKYPLADEEVVIARAQALLDKGAKLTDDKGNINENAWDKIWASVNDTVTKRFEGHYKKQIGNQTKANVKGRDVASGGGIPGQAPKKMTMREATEHAIATLTGRQQ